MTIVADSPSMTLAQAMTAARAELELIELKSRMYAFRCGLFGKPADLDDYEGVVLDVQALSGILLGLKAHDPSQGMTYSSFRGETAEEREVFQGIECAPVHATSFKDTRIHIGRDFTAIRRQWPPLFRDILTDERVADLRVLAEAKGLTAHIRT